MKISRIAVPAVVAALLGGCASGNSVLLNSDMATLSGKIIPGKTTEVQVKELFSGEPSSTCQDKDGNDIWIYSAQKEDTNLGEYFRAEKDVHRKVVRIVFDKSGTAMKVNKKTDNSTVSMLDSSGANQCQ